MALFKPRRVNVGGREYVVKRGLFGRRVFDSTGHNRIYNKKVVEQVKQAAREEAEREKR